MTFLDLDVASDESVTAAVEQVIDRFGRIDVLVNNAGIGSAGAAEESSVAQAQGVFDINVFGVIRMTKAVLPHMRARGSGRIINISSIVGFMPAALHGRLRRLQARRSRATPSPSTTRSASTASGRCSSNPPGPTPRSTRPACGPTGPWTSTPSSGTSSRSTWPAAVKDGDDPAVVAKEIVAAATDAKPKLRYTAGAMTGRVRTMRRIVPARMFDQQLRKLNRLPA